jgi:hypothetical protein
MSSNIQSNPTNSDISRLVESLLDDERKEKAIISLDEISKNANTHGKIVVDIRISLEQDDDFNRQIANGHNFFFDPRIDYLLNMEQTQWYSYQMVAMLNTSRLHVVAKKILYAKIRLEGASEFTARYLVANLKEENANTVMSLLYEVGYQYQTVNQMIEKIKEPNEGKHGRLKRINLLLNDYIHNGDHIQEIAEKSLQAYLKSPAIYIHQFKNLFVAIPEEIINKCQSYLENKTYFQLELIRLKS